MLTDALQPQTVSIEQELKESYLDYAMSVIVGRALPDVRDGLKPVHRRVLYAMNELSNDYNKPFKKSARVVGDVIGKYHPHGDTAVYDAIVRMAQDFSMRYMLVDGQGNFGSVDGDPAAAMRYTEVRMQRITADLLADLDKETVEWAPNYDGSETVPTVLPTKVPNLLINGASGIAVGMATNIPPHNITEIINACVALIDTPSISVEQLMQYVPGPDFPTGGIIFGRQGIVDAYRTGRGKIQVRAKAFVEISEKNNRESIIVSELPYQINKAKLIEKIADLAKDKRIEGISALRDESDKDGMRIVIDIKRGESGEVVLNNLYKETSMQTTFGMNMVSLVNNRPTTLGLKEMLEEFLRFRREVVVRRSVYDLRKARERAHALEGLMVALENIDAVILQIRQSQNSAEAVQRLMFCPWTASDLKALVGGNEELVKIDGEPTRWVDEQDGYALTESQAQEILSLRLHRLTGLERDKIEEEFRGLVATITELLDIIYSEVKLLSVIRGEMEALRMSYGDNRRTEINIAGAELNMEDLIVEQDVVVTLSHQGYVKYQPLSTYDAQKRGGRGKSAAPVKGDDFIDKLLVTSSHSTILCFSTIGKVYWLKVYAIPEASRGARGRPIINLLPLQPDERITSMLPVADFKADQYVFFATALGKVKKTALADFSRPMSSGIRALSLAEGDSLIGVDLTDGSNEIMLFTSAGKVVRFFEGENGSTEPDEDGEVPEPGEDEPKSSKGVRPMGRSAAGVRGVKMPLGDTVVSLLVPRGEGAILTVTQNGYGKRTLLSEYPTKSRATQGVISIKVSERNGRVVDAIQVDENDEIMLITNAGTLVRTRCNEVSIIGRNTGGVRLIRPQGDEQVVGMERIIDDAE